MASVKIKNKSFKFYKLSSKLTFASFIMLGIILTLLYFFITDQYASQSLDKLDKRAQFISDFIVAKLEMSIKTKNSKKIDQILDAVIVENGLKYVVLSNNSGTFFKAFNLLEAEKNFYVLAGKDNELSANGKTFKIVKPVDFKDKDEGNIYIGFTSSDYIHEVNHARLVLGFAFLTVLLFGTIFFYLLNYFLTSPVRKIAESAIKVSNGNLKQRTKCRAKNELGVLAKSFNGIVDELERSYAHLDTMNRQLKGYFKEKIGELNLEINQRKKVEDSLRQSEEHFRLLFEAAPIGMIQGSIDGKIEKVNNAFCDTLGYLPHEVIGMYTQELTFNGDKVLDKKYHQILLEGKEPYVYYEKQLTRKDNEVIDTIFESVIIRDKNNKPLHIISQFIDISERKRVEKELIKAKEKAEESDRLKSAFLAQMSHEIRTPLNVILTATPLLADDMNEDPEGTKCVLDSVSSAGKRLQRTIDLILNMSSVQSGNYKAEFEVVNIVDELRKLSEEFRSLCIEKNLSLSFTNHVKDSRIYVDQYTINQVFQNLIGNAVKYTIRGKVEIVISDEQNDKLKVEIKDTGIGISDEYKKNLFKPFSQEDVGQKREFEGNGLGLALVKKYVEINDAEIFVKSEKNAGSTFTVVFGKFFETRTSQKMPVDQVLKKAGIR